MNKFTPGPWVAGGCSGRMIQPKSKEGLDYWLADVDTKANAQLIAAAPMMLEALEIALDLINELAPSTQLGYLSDEENKKRDVIEAAIRAAEND